MQKIIIFIPKLIYRLIVFSVTSLDKHAFSYSFNLLSYTRGSPARVKWNGDYFLATDKNFPNARQSFRAQKQGFMAYHKGFEHRINDLASCYFISHIDFLPGDCVLDCGANVGDLYLYFMLNNISVDYIGFEPSPVEFSCLKNNIPNGSANNIALWNEKGDLNFYVSSQGADSSIIKPTDYDEVVTVKTEKLSSYINGPVKCLKLEAEGGEPEVLIGLGNKLKNIEYICADVGFERGIRQESTLVAVSNILLENGFEMVKVGRNRLCVLYKNKA